MATQSSDDHRHTKTHTQTLLYSWYCLYCRGVQAVPAREQEALPKNPSTKTQRSQINGSSRRMNRAHYMLVPGNYSHTLNSAHSPAQSCSKGPVSVMEMLSSILWTWAPGKEMVLVQSDVIEGWVSAYFAGVGGWGGGG